MKVHLKKILISALLVGFSNFAIADSIWFTGTINWLYPMGNGELVVTFKEDSPSCTHTNNPKYHYLSVGQNSMTQEGFNNVYSLLLTAATTKKKVKINFDSSAFNCYINRAFVVFD